MLLLIKIDFLFLPIETYSIMKIRIIKSLEDKYNDLHRILKNDKRIKYIGKLGYEDCYILYVIRYSYSIIISADVKGYIAVWDLLKFKMVTIFRAHSGCINKIIMLKNGRVASCGNGGYLRIWDMTNYKKIAESITLRSTPYDVIQLKDETIIVLSGNGTISYLSENNYEELQDVKICVNPCMYLYDNNVVTEYEGILQLRTRSMKVIKTIKYGNPHMCLESFTDLGDNMVLLTNDTEYMYLIDMKNEIVNEMKFRYHTMCVSRQKNGNLVILEDDNIKIYSETFQCLGLFPRIGTDMIQKDAFDLGDGLIVSIDKCSNIYIWNLSFCLMIENIDEFSIFLLRLKR